MSNYQKLRDQILRDIKANGNGEITGQLLQNGLIGILDDISSGDLFQGVALPTTRPEMIDASVFYLASKAGAYTHFGGIEVLEGELCALINESGSWSKVLLVTIKDDMSSLSDTAISDPKQDEVPTWDETLQKWVNKPQKDRDPSVEIVQTTGQDATVVMSQKAATNSFEAKGTAYSKDQADTRFEERGKAYSKAESDAKYEVKGANPSVPVVQEIGQSSTSVMSQAASTNTFELKGTAYGKSESDQRYAFKGEGGGGDGVAIDQTTGQSTTSVMSQKASTDSFELKGVAYSKSETYNKKEVDDKIAGSGGTGVDISQTTGQSTTSVMSQKAVTTEINRIDTDIEGINAILDARFPFTITSFTGGKVVENNTSTSVALAWVYDGIPTSQELKQGSTVIATALADRAKTVSNLTGAGNDIVFTISANGKSRTTTLQFRNCKRVGSVTTAPTTEVNVNALTKIAATTSRAYTWNGALDNNAVAYCYPKSFGALTSIKDANNFEYLSSFARTEVTANGELYYVYTSPVATAASFRYVFA